MSIKTKYLLAFIVILLFNVFVFSAECNSFNKVDIRNQINNDTIQLENCRLVRCDLPDKYYKDIDYYSFLAYMSYKSITCKKSNTYKLLNSDNAYTDSLGFRRYKIINNKFCVNNEDDYFVAIGNFYKEKGSSGDRFLIVTDKSMYTVIVGDEKSNNHTDKLHMFEWRKNNCCNLLEFIVDIKRLEKSVKKAGNVIHSSNEIINGIITHIFRIEE